MMSTPEDKVYFKDWFVESSDRSVSQRMRSLCKWWLELVRNIGVVALLGIFAERADNWAVTLISNISLGAVCFSAASYAHDWIVNPFPQRAKRSKLWNALALAIAALFTLAVWFLIITLVSVSIREISHIQGAKI